MNRSTFGWLGLALGLLHGPLPAQLNPRYTYSIDGPCGGTIVGPPGTTYDDGTGGAPYFSDKLQDGMQGNGVPRMRPGHTWDVLLTTEENITEHYGACAWEIAVGVEGPLRITDITFDGTAGCARSDDFPECQRWVGFAVGEITGPPGGGGPQTPGNRGAYGAALVKFDCVATLPPQGTTKVFKLRVSGDFPAAEGEAATGRVFFAPRVTSRSDPIPIKPAVYGPVRTGNNIFVGNTPVTVDRGDPPLAVRDCVVTLKASSVGAFRRCDANEDGGVSLSDAVWILNELFLGGAATRCRPAADCDGSGERDVSDAVYALSHLFLGGPEPPPPFRFCDRIDVPVEECPPGATACP